MHAWVQTSSEWNGIYFERWPMFRPHVWSDVGLPVPDMNHTSRPEQNKYTEDIADVQEHWQSPLYLTFTTQYWTERNIEVVNTIVNIEGSLESFRSEYIYWCDSAEFINWSYTGGMGLSLTPNCSAYVQEHI
jgi:hypothetical protein